MPDAPPLPLVVRLGFAGSRTLLDRAAHPQLDAGLFQDRLQRLLADRLRRLPQELGLSDRHFVCGTSQLAAGADTLFTRACRDLGWPQRIFLPQAREEFLRAVGSSGTPDFTAEEAAVARALFDSPHVVQEAVVTTAGERDARFEDVNVEIVRDSDVLVCLLRADAVARPGGTRDLLARAVRQGRPVLEIVVGVKDGLPVLCETWHAPRAAHGPAAPGTLPFEPPALPRALADMAPMDLPAPGALPESRAYAQALKGHASAQAAARSGLFARAAWLVIGSHVVATLLAVVAFRPDFEDWLVAILGLEAVLLGAGFGTHILLHRSGTTRQWAVNRLLAEVSRSLLAVGSLHVRLKYLFVLPFPPDLGPLLGTLSVLHLRTTRATAPEPWTSARDSYVATRLGGPNGQLAFYARKAALAGRLLGRARWSFWTLSPLAILSVLLEVLVTLQIVPVAHKPLTGILGALAIVLPVLAVAVLSFANAFDLTARHHTFTEMHAFLTVQEGRLRQATSVREFGRLLQDTESRLLGETVNWFSRRVYTGVP